MVGSNLNSPLISASCFVIKILFNRFGPLHLLYSDLTHIVQVEDKTAVEIVLAQYSVNKRHHLSNTDDVPLGKIPVVELIKNSVFHHHNTQQN